MARGKGEGSLQQDSRGLWRASVELPPAADGKRRRKTVSSKNKATAIKKLRELQRELQEHGDIMTRSTSVEGWVTKWLDEIAPETRTPKTMVSYRATLTTHVVKRFGKKPLDKLTTGMINDMLKDVAARRSPRTARNLYSYLSACLKDAVGFGILARHPMTHLRPPAVKRDLENALEVDQVVSLLKWLAQQIDQNTEWARLAPLFILYLLTGARRGEPLGLTPERILDDSLNVEWQLQWIKPEDLARVAADYEHTNVTSNYYLVRPKSKAGWRSYPLVEPLRSMMHTLRDQTPPGQLVFTRPSGEPWNPDRITKLWLDLLHDAGIQDRDTPKEDRVTLHGARHTVVDLLYMLDVPEHVISDIVGHSSREVTRRYRTKQSPAAIDAMQSMSKLLSR